MVDRKPKTQAGYYATDNITGVLTRNQASAYLKICKNNLDALSIPKIHIGKLIRFRKTDIDAWLENAIKVVATC
ncbi:helix-turn-helix MerR-family like proteins [Candidatus Termititenax persephonae]|uniref:Helix-turn-helix MerR-family like proteins n=1 Tax=Candidatus Termititenax persephonae TaxID=2218525 RepID=A0A388TGB5_9BACT|nr:helix-turn-helix MerR-family like proteins [Candidatus Termititenax persephonae]